MHVIEVTNLQKKYKNFEAVKGISFSVEKGEIFGILGPNGAGKTTTLEIIEGLKNQSSGNCLVLGLDNRKDGDGIKKRIGVQLQSSEYLDMLNLAELIQLFASFYKKRVDPIAVLKRVNLESKAKNTVKELSGGQKQRFTIATALVHDPEILFLDEPTTGLDPSARRNMWDLIKDINNQGITVVLTTHYMEEAEYLCNRVAIMDGGKILQLDSPQKLINDLHCNSKLSFFLNKKIDEHFFDGIPSIVSTVIEEPKTTLELKDIEVLPQILEKMRKADINYSFLNLRSSTLEDVYLSLTGREYEA